MKGEEKPDYARCVAISTAGAQREMLVPSLLAIIIPVLTGLILGIPGRDGNARRRSRHRICARHHAEQRRRRLDNAKKHIENGAYGGKKLADGSKNPTHAAAVIGDTVGDPCKDTSGSGAEHSDQAHEHGLHRFRAGLHQILPGDPAVAWNR